MQSNYSVQIEKYAEKHFIKSFQKKYKGHWDVTLRAITAELERIDMLINTSRAETICEVGGVKIVKTEFRVSGTPPRPLPGFICGGISSGLGHCRLTVSSPAFNDIVPSYIPSVDFIQDLDWSGLTDPKPVYIYDMKEFITYVGGMPNCGVKDFNEYEYLILFPLADTSGLNSNTNFNLPFPATGMMYFDSPPGGYYYCIGA
jgi:hypothetical protein